METPDTTIHPASPDIIYTQTKLTRQQRRHAQQALEHEQAVAKQGKRYIRGFSNNPKYPRHIGAKQLAKMRLRQGAPMEQSESESQSTPDNI